MTSIPRTVRALAALLALSALAAVGCSDGDDGPEIGAPTTTRPQGGGRPVRQPALEGSLTVAASDSMGRALMVSVDEFTRDNPGVQVELRVDTTSALAMRLLDGEPTDVFISSDRDNMEVLVEAELIDGTPLVVARNIMVVVTRSGDDSGIAALADLADAGEIALCDTGTPCGAFADEILEAAGVSLPSSSISRHASVTDALDAVVEGEAVAAVVYATTAADAGDDVEVVEIPSDINIVTPYPAATLVDSGNNLAARAFIDFLLEPIGQAVLEEHGFLPAG